MPNVDLVTLRGLMAQIARRPANPVKFDNISRFDMRPMLQQRGFNALSGTELQQVKEPLKEGPYPTHGEGALEQFSFEYWYNYFFKELPSGVKLDFALPIINDDGTLRSEDQVPNKIQLFQKMLKLGFHKFEAGDHFTAQQLLLHAGGDPLNLLQVQQVNVLFRGDGRKWPTIQDNLGTVPQSRVQYLRETRGMTKPWHPFNLQGNSVWVRNGEVNKDNCLFSAVSVTPQFGVATKFPLLNDLTGSNPSAVGHAIVVVRDRAAAAPAAGSAFQQARARFQGPPAAAAEKSITLPASQTNIYCVVMKGAFNTQKYQENAPFPEYASDDLTLADHLAWFSITRIHFSEVDGNAGHLIVVDDFLWLHDEDLIQAALLGPNSFPALKRFVDDLVQRGRLNKGIGGIVYTPPGVAPPPFEIVRVRESFVAGRGNLAKPPVAQPAARPAPGKITIPAAFRR